MIGIVLGSLEPAFRRALDTELRRHPELDVVGDTGTSACLTLLVATLRPSLVVVDARWAQACPDLLRRLLARPAPPRILLYADTLARPEVVAAVKQGVHGCLPRDSKPATWHRAILAVHAGEPWIPRWLMAEALTDMKQLLQSERPAAPDMEKLTDRQREIVRWAAQGLSNKEIGRHLGISPTTVKTHLQNIFERVGISGRRQLVVHALGHTRGMSPPPTSPCVSVERDEDPGTLIECSARASDRSCGPTATPTLPSTRSCPCRASPARRTKRLQVAQTGRVRHTGSSSTAHARPP